MSATTTLLPVQTPASFRKRLTVVRSLLGGDTDVGCRGDFDQLNSASEDGYGSKYNDAGFDHFSIADKIKAHSQ
jgi:hypothetical protein